MTDPTRPIPNFTLTHAMPRPKQPGPIDPKGAQELKLRKAAKDFESLFLSQLIKTMQSTINKTESGKSLGGEVMMDLASEKLAENLASKGGVGLGDMIYASMKRHLHTDTTGTPVGERPIPRDTDRHFYPLTGTEGGVKK